MTGVSNYWVTVTIRIQVLPFLPFFAEPFGSIPVVVCGAGAPLKEAVVQEQGSCLGWGLTGGPR